MFRLGPQQRPDPYGPKFLPHRRPPFPADPRPDPGAGPILRAMDMPVIDHRGPEFGKLGRRVLDGIKTIFKCAGR